MSGDADRAVRQIFGNSDDESDLDFDFDKEDLKTISPLAVHRRSEGSEDEMFDLSCDKEVEKTEECSSDILTREYFNVDCEFVGPTMRMSPSK